MGGSEFTSYDTILNLTAPSLIFIASHSLLSYKLKRLRYSCCARCLKGKMSLLMDYALIMALWQIFLPGNRAKHFLFHKLR